MVKLTHTNGSMTFARREHDMVIKHLINILLCYSLFCWFLMSFLSYVKMDKVTEKLPSKLELWKSTHYNGKKGTWATDIAREVHVST